jgi:hypothetical protein
MPTKEDCIEVFGILELALPLDDAPRQAEAFLRVENQRLNGHVADDGTLRFRFCPKAAKTYSFTIESNVSSLDGKTGAITAYVPLPDTANQPSARFPNWWTDDLAIEVAEGSHSGAKTVSRWREDYLSDFAKRMLLCSVKRQ